MAYRNDRDALQAHCDKLRRELKDAEVGSEELRKLNEELESSLIAMGALRIGKAERQIATHRLAKRSRLIGAAVALSVVVLVLGGVNLWVWQSRVEVEPVVIDRSDVPIEYTAAEVLAIEQGSHLDPASMPGVGGPDHFSRDELVQLTRDIKALQVGDKSPEIMSEVIANFRSGESHLVQRMRRNILLSRSRAAVPLLLKQSKKIGNGHGGRESAFLFTMLTGEHVAGHSGLNEKTAVQLYREWYLGARESFTTKACDMSDTRRRTVVRAMLETMATGRGGNSNQNNANGGYARRQSSDHEFSATLCAGMVDDLVSMLSEEGLHTGATKMLGLLRKKGDAPQLDALMHSAMQSSATRLAALLARAQAGEPLEQKVLLQLFAKEKDPTLRERMIRAMAKGDEGVVDVLLAELEGPQSRAALDALVTFKSPKAIPQLRRMLLASTGHSASSKVARLLIAIGTVEATEVLAENLKRQIRADGGSNLKWALIHFQRSRGVRAYNRDRTNAELRKAAREELAEWKKNK